jgi:hypothetical protein
MCRLPDMVYHGLVLPGATMVTGRRVRIGHAACGSYLLYYHRADDQRDKAYQCGSRRLLAKRAHPVILLLVNSDHNMKAIVMIVNRTHNAAICCLAGRRP